MFWRSYRKTSWTRKRPKTEREKELDKTWRLMSEYIRKRDVNDKGYGYCCTCYMQWKLWGVKPRPIHWKEWDAWHYVGVARQNTKFNEQNIHLQCRDCNRMEHGEQSLHGKYVDMLYWDGTADRLQIEKKILKKRTIEELIDLQIVLKEKIQEIHNKNGRDKRRTVVNAKRKDPNILFDWL